MTPNHTPPRLRLHHRDPARHRPRPLKFPCHLLQVRNRPLPLPSAFYPQQAQARNLRLLLLRLLRRLDRPPSVSSCRRLDLALFIRLRLGQRRRWAECSAGNRFLNVPVLKRHMARVRQLVPVRVQAAYAVPCTQRGSTRPAHLDRARECQGVLALERRVPELGPRLAWLLRPEPAIVHRADINSGAGETIATKNRRKVQ